jgi:hypothetical protein
VCIAEKYSERERQKKYLLGIRKKGDLDFFVFLLLRKKYCSDEKNPLLIKTGRVLNCKNSD